MVEVTVAVSLDIPLNPNGQRIVCNGVDVTQVMRKSELSRVVSRVVMNLRVCVEMKWHWRGIMVVVHMGIIAKGRGTVTVVTLDAGVRVLLTTSEATRFIYCAHEVRSSGGADTPGAARDEVLRRNADDLTISKSMTAEDGVVETDSSTSGINEAVEVVVSLVPKECR